MATYSIPQRNEYSRLESYCVHVPEAQFHHKYHGWGKVLLSEHAQPSEQMLQPTLPTWLGRLGHPP